MQSNNTESDEEITAGAAQESTAPDLANDQHMEVSDEGAHEGATLGGSDHKEMIEQGELGQGEPRRNTSALAPSAQATTQQTTRDEAVPAEAVSAESAGTSDTMANLRAEHERLLPEVDTRTARAQRPAPAHNIRRALAGTLLVLSCLTLLLSTVTVWAEQTFLNNDARWTAVVGPMGHDPNVINAVSAYVADQIVTGLQVQQRAQNALPPQGQFLATPITDMVRQFTQNRVANAMRTKQFQQAWLSVNSAVHSQVVAALRGQTQPDTNANGALTLNLLPVITQGLQTVRQESPGLLPPQVHLPPLRSTESAQQGIHKLLQALGIQLPQNFGQVTLLQPDQFATAQQIVRLLDLMRIILPVVTLVALVATLWLSHDRRRMVMELGIGIAITFALAKIAIPVLQQQVVASVADPTAREIIQPVIERALSYLVTSTTWLLILGIVVALVAFLVGKREWFQAGL